MKIYVTKYALSQGILEYEPLEITEHGMAIVRDDDRFSGRVYFHGEGKDWCRTEAQAKEKANLMVKNKISSLKKSIQKFEKLVF